jgi:receptor protein-tyrosine kinase
MKDLSNAQQFGQLRARIEATFSEPALIVVTSAARGDGKTATAFGLAESLAQAEHRVLFVDANYESPTLPRIHRIANLAARPDLSKMSRFSHPVAGHRFEGLSLADERLETGMSMDKVKAAAFDLRAHFDFVIVDTCALLRSDLAVLFSTIADGTLLTLRLGRLPSSADETVMKTLRRVGATTLGVLTIRPNTIRTFASQREQVFQTIRVPARPFTSRHTLEPETARDVVEPRSNVVS